MLGEEINAMKYMLPILTNNGRIIGLLPETELPQLFNQIFIHITHHQ